MGRGIVISARVAATGAVRHTRKCSVLIGGSIPRALGEDDRDFYTATPLQLAQPVLKLQSKYLHLPDPAPPKERAAAHSFQEALLLFRSEIGQQAGMAQHRGFRRCARSFEVTTGGGLRQNLFLKCAGESAGSADESVL